MIPGCARRIPPTLLMLLTALMPAGPAAATPCPHFAPPAVLAETRHMATGPITIVALGSSSTEGAGASSPEASYPARLEALLRAALPGRDVRVVNAGRSGQTSDDMLARIDADVLAHQPSLVVWQAGGNEALRGGDPAAFLRVMQAGLAKLAAAGVPVVLVDNQRSPRMQAAGAARFDAIMAGLASPAGIGLFPRGAWHAAATEPEALVAPDRLHHNDAGYACLAGALADALLPALRPPGEAMARR